MSFALFKRNYLNRYSGMGLSYFWLIFMPCLPLFLYNALSALGVFSEGNTSYPRGLHLTTGIVIYYFFSESISNIATAVETNKSYIIKTGISIPSCYLEGIIECYANFVLRYVVLGFAFLLFGYNIPVNFYIFPVFLPTITILSVGVGIILSIFVVFYRDFLNIIQAILFYLLFASGVFLEVPKDSAFYQYLVYLPSRIWVENFRNFIFETPITELNLLITTSAFGILILILSLLAYRNSKSALTTFLK